MSPDATYNGYANYQTWNVCLWISNDEGLRDFASECRDYNDFKDRIRELDPMSSIAYETNDRVAWNDSNVNLAEMQEYWNENFSKANA